MDNKIANIFVFCNGKVTGPYSQNDVMMMSLPVGAMLSRNNEGWLEHSAWKQRNSVSGKAVIPVVHDPAQTVVFDKVAPQADKPAIPSVKPYQPAPSVPQVPDGAFAKPAVPTVQPVPSVPQVPDGAFAKPAVPTVQPVPSVPQVPGGASAKVAVPTVQPVPSVPQVSGGATPKPVMPAVPSAGASFRTQPRSTINPIPLEKITSDLSNSSYRICPHCGTPFDLGKINYISTHPDLIGDPLLGENARKRFLPTSFDARGYAIDERGFSCQEMACPHCHLQVPEACCQLFSTTFSIVGAPSCGKSYFMTAMLWQLRNTLAGKFDFSLNDTDEQFNSVLNEYENLLFLNRDRSTPVSLPKTAEFGENYSNRIYADGIWVDLPRPFIFTLTPLSSNPLLTPDQMHNIIFYDNAGEHFAPGRNSVSNLATQHLVHSECITFLYDPMQDSRMALQCDENDPQQSRNYHANQLVLFNEMVARIRRYTGLQMREKCSKTLVVVIPKYDAWQELFPMDLRKTDFIYRSRHDFQNYLNVGAITGVSYAMRTMLKEVVPELVSACESFFESVYFIPVSALGHIPELKNNEIAIKPEDIAPVWAEVPMLIQLYNSGFIQGADAYGCNDKEVVHLCDYECRNGAIICNIPGTSIREVLPMNYSGFKIYIK